MNTLAAVDIANSLEQALTDLVSFLPKLIGFLVILLIGYIVARIVKSVIARLLGRLHVDRRLHESPAGNYVEKFSPGASPSRLVGGVAFWLIFIIALTSAIGALQIPAVTAFMNMVLAYLPNVIVAILIFVAAAAVAGGIGGLVHRTMGDTSTGRLVASIVPGIVLSIAVFMILTQLNIAPEIVQTLFTAIVAALALGLALAFGLGGRNVAERLLEEAYQRGREEKETAKADLRTGRERGRRDVEQTRTQVEGGGAGAPGTAGSPTQPATGAQPAGERGVGPAQPTETYRNREGR
jgi:Conserved TM helix